ncbi:GreA/GreB family elongation factor [uncultured Jatrophihabitans sp.]|uniref:GreA/GreB family elongation factor n=1 Tax=uncultured Jatrophihabitans sp. TaxID=1610747 RepID=UPI0035CA0383
MTATLDRQSHRDALTFRLADLRAQRDQVLAEITPAGVGDDADRATNVEGHVNLAVLDERIVAVEVELNETAAGRSAADGTVSVGDVVTVDFGDGAETFLLGSVEAASDGLDVITPGSPLGRALQGASAGSTVSYSPRPRVNLDAKVIAID